MPKKKHDVIRSPKERAQLKAMTYTGGNHSAKELRHAQVLFLSNDGRPKKKLPTENCRTSWRFFDYGQLYSACLQGTRQYPRQFLNLS